MNKLCLKRSDNLLIKRSLNIKYKITTKIIKIIQSNNLVNRSNLKVLFTFD